MRLRTRQTSCPRVFLSRITFLVNRCFTYSLSWAPRIMAPSRNGPSSGRLADRTGCVGSIARFWQVDLHSYSQKCSTHPYSAEDICSRLSRICAAADSVYARKPWCVANVRRKLLNNTGPISCRTISSNVLSKQSEHTISTCACRTGSSGVEYYICRHYTFLHPRSVACCFKSQPTQVECYNIGTLNFVRILFPVRSSLANVAQHYSYLLHHRRRQECSRTTPPWLDFEMQTCLRYP